jgi:tetratricopeptide (TPR) repeat protein
MGIVLMLFGLVALARKNRLVIFGTLFFMANIILLLQLLPVGSAIMADRYTYLAYTGLFFIFAVAVTNYYKSNTALAKSLRPLLVLCISAYMIFLVVTTYNRNEVWQDSYTLWSDVMVKYPRCYMSYNQIGSVHQGQATLDDESGQVQEGRKKLAAALMDFKNAIGLNPQYPEAYVNRSDVYRVEGKLDSAIRDCDSALKYRPNYPEAYINRGIALASSGMDHGNKRQIDSAMNDFKHAVRLDHNLPNIYANMGNIYDMNHKLDSAIACYTKAIVLDPTQITPYESRGRSLEEKGSLDSALNDLNTSIQMYQDKHLNAMESYYQRSLVYNEKGNKKQALQDALTARSLGKPIADSYINSLKQ